MSNAPTRFPWWVPLGAVAVALAFLPALASPFDFTGDGNLVYPAPAGTSLEGHAQLWWANVVVNVEHFGPFRPTLWAHWHVQADFLSADPLVCRSYRVLWCVLAAGMLLWLMRELKISPLATLLAVCGCALYLPMDGMSGRCAVPAAWGLDVLFAVLALCVGPVAVLSATLLRQEKGAARADAVAGGLPPRNHRSAERDGDVGAWQFVTRRAERGGGNSRRVAPRPPWAAGSSHRASRRERTTSDARRTRRIARTAAIPCRGHPGSRLGCRTNSH